MNDIKPAFVIMIIALICIIFFAGYYNTKNAKIDLAKYEQYISFCTYLGNRIETGWHGGTIYQYTCPNGYYETRKKPKDFYK